MEQIEEGLMIAAAVMIFAMAVSCLFIQQRSLEYLEELVNRNYHRESFLEEYWYE